MKNCLSVALIVKEYIENQGRTLTLSQGKMLIDKDPITSFDYNKQTA